MKKLLVLLSCGHHIEQGGLRLGANVRFFTEAQDERKDVVCHRGSNGAHESFVVLVLTSTTDRIWLEEP